MPKKTKTRKQKIKAEQRKTLFGERIPVAKAKKADRIIDEQPQTHSYPLPAVSMEKYLKPQKPVATKTIVSKDYGSLTHDIRKTTIVTGAIVLVQLLVYFIM